MGTGVLDGVPEAIDDVMPARELCQRADRRQGRHLLGANPLEDDGDAAGLEVIDDLLEGVRSARIEHPYACKPQHDHADIRHLDEGVEEPLGRPEEEGTVDPVNRDVFVQQGLLAAR